MEEENKTEPIKEANPPETPSKLKLKHIHLLLAGVLIFTFVLLLGGLYVKSNMSEEVENEAEVELSATSTPTPTVSATPTLKITPTSSPKTPTAAPVVSGNAGLTIDFGSGPASVTITNQATGKSTSESLGSGKTYKLPSGDYTVTVADKPGYKTGYSRCSSNCNVGGGSYGGSSWGNSTSLNIQDNVTNGIYFYFIDQNSLPSCSGGKDSPTCM